VTIMTSRTVALSLLTTGALVLAACGDDEPAVGPRATTPATQTAPQTSAAGASTSEAVTCPDVPVPGHLAENVKATGLDCDATVAIANEAEGRGRAPYTSRGFACEPTDADAGKTNYSCTMGEAKLTFLYG